MLKCLIAFIFGWLVSRQMGNGFSVGGTNNSIYKDFLPCIKKLEDNMTLTYPPESEIHIYSKCAMDNVFDMPWDRICKTYDKDSNKFNESKLIKELKTLNLNPIDKTVPYNVQNYANCIYETYNEN